MDSPAVNTRIGLLAGRSPLLRFQSDERLIALIRAGHEGAFELLFERYRPRLLSFCRHMLGSKEDAEDVLQDVFAASYNAMCADDRALNVRPWLYRIARNRCLNHLRRPRPDGRDTMDDQIGGHGITTADIVHRRVDFRHLLQDIHKLPETQRTALLLREIDVLSYEQIADAMETTVPSVKSLLVRARMSLAEAAEARQLTCNDVRRELAEVAEGLKKTTPPVRRHVRDCEQCGRYRTQLRKTSTAMAIAFPLGPMLLIKKLFLAKLGAAAAAGGGGVAGTGAGGGLAAGGAATSGAAAGGLAAGSGAAAGGIAAGGGAAAGGFAAGGGAAAGGLAAGGIGAVATKAITVTAATALLAGGAVEVHHLAAPTRPAPRQEIVQPKKPSPFQSGGQAAATLPSVPAVKEELKRADSTSTDATKKDDKAPASGTTDEAVPTPVEGDTPLPPTGTTDPGVPIEANPPPVDGLGQPAPDESQTGGAQLPPPTESQPPNGTGSPSP
jgi:RNA polymerase sigma factor (sigma-70 family)